jgi:hypothetical protein
VLLEAAITGGLKRTNCSLRLGSFVALGGGTPIMMSRCKELPVQF